MFPYPHSTEGEIQRSNGLPKAIELAVVDLRFKVSQSVFLGPAHPGVQVSWDLLEENEGVERAALRGRLFHLWASHMTFLLS
jgi:hypothetical protein